MNEPRQIRLSDGRRLGFCERGDPQGKPLLYFHGFPGSRLEVEFAHKTAEGVQVRIIGIDRPGYGLSDSMPGRTLLDWPDDVIELADALGINRFGIMGVSGGGPYAVACAAAIHHRLSAAGIVCGMGPIDVPHGTDGMNRLNKIGLKLVRITPWFAKILLWLAAPYLRCFPEHQVDRVASKAGEPDKSLLRREEIKEILKDSFRESVRTGSSGALQDLLIYIRPWHLAFPNISLKVYVWHGERDVIVPPAMGRYIASSIPNSRARFYPDEGHFSLLYHHYREIMLPLVE